MKASKIKHKYRNFGIKNLMFVIISANILVYLLSMFGNINLSLALALIPSRVLQGEIWRVISYIFIPPTFNPFFLIFVLMFYFYIGRELENYWGTFKFNLYYFSGVLISSVIAMIFNIPVVGVSDLNMSLFLAYAVLSPDHMLYLFMVFPIKMKYLAIVTLTILGYKFFTTGFWQIKFIVIAPILNFLIFFLPYFLKNTKSGIKARKRRQVFESKVLKFEDSKISRHRCCECKKTEKDDENLEFRYCSKCNGSYEYCSEHIFNHEHRE